jgi:hypothetical protein
MIRIDLCKVPTFLTHFLKRMKFFLPDVRSSNVRPLRRAHHIKGLCKGYGSFRTSANGFYNFLFLS